MFYIYDIDRANSIKKVFELEGIENENWQDIQNAFHNYHYYINLEKYEKPDDEHYRRLDDYLNQETKITTLDAHSKSELFTNVCLKVIKELFDPVYFEERLKYHKTHNDKECLFEYMNKLSLDQLKQLLPVILGSIFVFSWNEKAVDAVWNLLNEACLEKDPTAMVTTEIYDKYGYFNKKIPMYFFEYLDRETVINIVCNNICDENKYNAATLARIMYTEGIEEVEYTESVWWCDC